MNDNISIAAKRAGDVYSKQPKRKGSMRVLAGARKERTRANCVNESSAFKSSTVNAVKAAGANRRCGRENLKGAPRTAVNAVKRTNEMENIVECRQDKGFQSKEKNAKGEKAKERRGTTMPRGYLLL